MGEEVAEVSISEVDMIDHDIVVVVASDSPETFLQDSSAHLHNVAS